MHAKNKCKLIFILFLKGEWLSTEFPKLLIVHNMHVS